jgi:hypothetical protein
MRSSSSHDVDIVGGKVGLEMVHRARADDGGGDRAVSDHWRSPYCRLTWALNDSPAILLSSWAERPTSARLTTDRPPWGSALLGDAHTLLKLRSGRA